MESYQQLSLLLIKETRFLIPTVNPNYQKPGFLESSQKLSLLCTKETRFLIPTVNPNSQKPGFLESDRQLSLLSTKETRFLIPRNRVSYLLPTVIFIIHQRNPVSFLVLGGGYFLCQRIIRTQHKSVSSSHPDVKHNPEYDVTGTSGKDCVFTSIN
ncbi:hypothetical protein [Planktothricoides raciborskii]|uniref:Uncharacterized protein n=1 Tax=Planktothricoides raciborskii FACHB-1370 TaxID=2949576 RepID=A0ABR8EIK8_9CYAN|nr:hypothetical protein [Planktothricoides raciborskii]MBD2545446.1 hypothetical protein [Planktothricoides raciborskii FACHB-1370]MBD2583674.1 hypothetical protein [Planktothricoides raciborskii FACHB-1261]